MRVVRILQWATGLVVALTIAYAIHDYWVTNPTATCMSAHGDTYLQVRACTITIALADIERTPNAAYYINRGEAEETNCDFYAASVDYKRAVDLAPKSKRASQLAMAAADIEGEYCPRGENGDRAEGVVLSGALVILPFALTVLGLICGGFWLASKRLLTSLLLTLASIAWLVALFSFYLAAMSLHLRPHFANYIPNWLQREILFELNIIVPLWCVLIASWLTFVSNRTWPKKTHEK